MARAPVSKTGGWGFESSTPAKGGTKPRYHYGSVWAPGGGLAATGSFNCAPRRVVRETWFVR